MRRPSNTSAAALVAGVAIVAVLAMVALVAGARVSPGDDPGPFTGTWQGPHGEPAARGEGSGYSFEVHALAGPAHCDWQSVTFLGVGWPLGTSPGTAGEMHQYVRDPEGVLAGVPLLGELDLDAELPAEAAATGYRTEGAELWFGPDGGDRYAYLRLADRVERWPRAAETIACA